MNRNVLALISLVIGLLTGYGICYAIYQPQISSYQFSNVSDSFQEPPACTDEIASVEDVITDLESLGCKIICVYEYRSHLSQYFDMGYTEFRRLAFNSKIVFFYSPSKYFVYLCSIIDGVIVSCYLNLRN